VPVVLGSDMHPLVTTKSSLSVAQPTSGRAQAAAASIAASNEVIRIAFVSGAPAVGASRAHVLARARVRVVVSHAARSSGGGAGKSALISQFVNKMFIEEYAPTVVETYRSSAEINSRVYVVEITDIGAQESFIGARRGHRALV